VTDEGQQPIKRIVLGASYASLFEAGAWREIVGCPGRMVLPGPRDATPGDLLGKAVVVQVFGVEGASDPVHVGVVRGGGLISYRKPDGRFVHTLNTPEGLARKLEQLGIELP
jgi:hypothetical protein